MALPLEPNLSIGLQNISSRLESAGGSWLEIAESNRRLIELVDEVGFDSIWFGDHLAYAIPILDPLVQIAQAATYSSRLVFGTCVYLLPLRHPGPLAKQIATLDHLCEGRFVFGVGVGGEFREDYDLAGVPIGERGSRMSETIAVLRALWTGDTVSHAGRHVTFDDIQMLPAPRTAGGPPIWCAARADAALRRTGRLASGWIPWAISVDRYRTSLERIAAAYHEAGRNCETFATGHLLYARLDKDRETALDACCAVLDRRFGMDFRSAAERFCAVGSADDVAAEIVAFYQSGARYILIDLIGPEEERLDRVRAFAEEVMPKISHLRQSPTRNQHRKPTGG